MSKTDELIKLEERLDKAMNYVLYLRGHCKYNLNDGHLRRLLKILKGER